MPICTTRENGGRADGPHRLRLEHIRLSPLESPVGVTVVVAYDARRLAMLDGVCSTWGGHISAAVYLVRVGGSLPQYHHGSVLKSYSVNAGAAREGVVASRLQ